MAEYISLNLTLAELNPTLISISTPQSFLYDELLLCAGSAGVLSHLGYFIRGEHHLEAPILLRLFLLVLVILPIIGIRFGQLGVQDAIFYTTPILMAYCTALFTSMILYRAFFHPLNEIPGPRLAKLTKLWHVTKLVNFDNYRQVDRLHKQYGDFVRTGMCGNRDLFQILALLAPIIGL